jgi:hypothetical protein
MREMNEIDVIEARDLYLDLSHPHSIVRLYLVLRRGVSGVDRPRKKSRERRSAQQQRAVREALSDCSTQLE